VKKSHPSCELLPLGRRPRIHFRTSDGVIALGTFISPARLVNDWE
jgi:hypothetical protein